MYEMEMQGIKGEEEGDASVRVLKEPRREKDLS